MENNYNYQNQGQPNNMGAQKPDTGELKTPGFGYALVSFICSIASILGCATCYGFAGIGLGVVALLMCLSAKRMDGGLVNPMAKAGFLCSIIGSALGVIAMIFQFVSCATSNFWF